MKWWQKKVKGWRVPIWYTDTPLVSKRAHNIGLDKITHSVRKMRSLKQTKNNTMQIKTNKTDRNRFEAIINNKVIGHFIRDVDGYFYYWPLESLHGSWNVNALRLIADKLDELNKEWDLQIQKYFNNEQNI